MRQARMRWDTGLCASQNKDPSNQGGVSHHGQFPH
jgi:hypothetical protein